MARILPEIEREIFQLNPKEKAALARNIIDDLDAVADENMEHLWPRGGTTAISSLCSGRDKSKAGARGI